MNILLISLIMVTLSGFVGLYIRSKIWGNANKPKNVFEYGRAWAAYLSFITPLSSIHFYTKKDFTLASIDFLICLFIFPLIAFLTGCVFGFVKSRISMNPEAGTGINSRTFISSSVQNINSDQQNDLHYEQALNEINSSSMKSSTWAKAIADSGGDDGKAKSKYIQYRVSELINQNIRNSDTSLKENFSFKFNSKFTLITAVVIISSFIALYLKNEKKENWLEISSFPNLVLQAKYQTDAIKKTNGTMTIYVDTNSISMANGFLYAFYGEDGSPNKEIGFSKMKGEFDCRGDKGFRIVEEYRYSSTLKSGLKKPFFKEIDYQKNIYIPREKDINPNYSYDGGWKTLTSLKDEISFFLTVGIAERVEARYMINYDRATMSLIDYVCSISTDK